MDADIRLLIKDRLKAEAVSGRVWAGAVVAACEGREVLEQYLLNPGAVQQDPRPDAQAAHPGAYLASLTVQGFRGVGDAQTVSFGSVPSSGGN